MDASGDNEAAYHKEDVHTDITAAENGEAGMEQHYGKYRDRAKTINVCPIPGLST